MKKTLIVFARKPVLGKVKKRLAKETEKEHALSTYVKLLDITTNVVDCVDATIKFYWTVLAEDKIGIKQRGKDLGQRMYNAIKSELKESNQVCLIGSDTPFITKQIIDEAFDALSHVDMVFGPAKDGGYYLVGMKNVPPKELFLVKKWSHANVLKEALEVCKQLNLEVHLLPTLLDIDTKEDFDEWIESQDNSKT